MKRHTSLSAAALAVALAFGGPAWAQTDPWSASYKFEAAGDYQQAAKQIEGLARKNEYAQTRLAYLLYMQARFDEAILAYQRAQEMNKDSFEALLGISLVLLAQGRWSDAQSQAEWVLKTAPGNYVAHMRVLVALEGGKDWQALSKQAEGLVRRYPSDATALVYAARSAAALGNKARAADAYDRVLQIVPGHIEASKYLGR